MNFKLFEKEDKFFLMVSELIKQILYFQALRMTQIIDGMAEVDTFEAELEV